MDTPPDISRQLGMLQVLVASLAVGVATFAIVAIAIPYSATGPAAPISVLRAACVALLGVTIVGAVLVRNLNVRAAASIDTDDAASDIRIFMRYYLGTTMAAALLEGPALFAVTNFLLGRDWTDLAIAAVPIVIMLAFFFPSRPRYETFVRLVLEQGPRR